MKKKQKQRMKKKEDRISALPDSMIQHILSFLPSTKQAIRTGILSKRWRNQWTQVPVLIFNHLTTGMSHTNFFNFIDKTLTLHDCSKIKKFGLCVYNCYGDYDEIITSKIRFAISKDVEDLDLSVSTISMGSSYYILPEFFFNNASLIKLTTEVCSFMPNGKVNWGSLTTLNIERCTLTEEAIERIVSGSPLLESFEVKSCSGFDKVVIASESLRRLVLIHYYYDSRLSVLEISCPKLEELSLDAISTHDPDLFARVIESVLSSSLLLESMSIQSIYCPMYDNKLVIASQSLKRLVVGDIKSVFDIEISCPKLEKLKLFERLNINAAKLMNLPSLLCATIDFHHDVELQTRKSLIEDILQQLQNVKELKIGSWIIEHNPGIANLLRISPITYA